MFLDIEADSRRGHTAFASCGSRRTGLQRASLFLLVLCLLLVRNEDRARALDPHRQIGQYGHESWTSDRGLPGEAVYQILQSRDGYLWLRTGAGLARFDGVRFVPMDDEIGRETVKALAMSADGDLLIRTTSRTVVYRDHTFADYIPPAALPDGGIRVLFESREHALLLGSDDFLYRLDHSAPSLLASGTSWINDIVEDHAGTIWAAGNTSLLTLVQGRVTQPFDMRPYGNVTNALLEDREHRLWAGTDDGLYLLPAPGAGARLIRQPGVPDHVTAAIEDRAGNLWVGTESAGLVRIDHGQVSTLNANSGLTDSDVLSLFEDREGSLWVGTASGLDRLRDTKLTTFGVREGLPTNSARSVIATEDGSVYVLTKIGGLSRIKDDVVTPFALNSSLAPVYSDALHQSRDGSIWMGTEAGLTRYQDGRLTVYTGKLDPATPWLLTWNRAGSNDTGEHFAHTYISAIGEDAESLIVATAECATFRFKDGHTYAFTLHGDSTPFTVPGLYTFTIYTAPGGVLWFGTSKGLYKLVPGAPEQSGLQAEVPFAVTSIYDDHQGNLWLGGRTPGLVRLHVADGHALRYTAEQGLFDGYLSHILPDAEGNLWISTQNGIYAVRLQELADVAGGRATRVSPQVYGLADGMKTTQAADTTAQPSGVRTPDGRLWFATYKGVAVVDPRHLQQNSLVPPITLESVVTDGQARPIGESLTIAPGMKSVEFHYSALSLSVPQRVRFRYQLEGYDHGWVEAGPRRVAYYTNLPPGSYRFRVIAANEDGIWNLRGASIEMTLRPHLYQTVPFYAFCFIGIVLLVFALVWRKTTQIRTQTAKLARLVEERTAELRRSQEELNMLAHFDSLTSLPNRRMFVEEFEKMRAITEGQRFSLLLIDFDKFKQINDTHGHDAGDAFLVEASLRLTNAVRHTDHVARLGGDEFAILLAGDHDEASMEQVCQRIVLSFASEVGFKGVNIATSASIGAAVFPQDGATQEELYKAADLALYEAKRRGRNKWQRADRQSPLPEALPPALQPQQAFTA